MFTTPDIVGLFTVLTAVPAPFLVYYLRRDMSKPGVLWLALFICGAAVWACAFGLLTIFDSRTLTLWLFHVDLFAVTLVAICWFLFTVEFTHRVSMQWSRIFLPLLIPTLVIQLLAWSNESHHLLYTAGTVVDAQGALHVETSIAFLFHTGYGMSLIVMAVGILVGEAITTTGDRQRQCLILLLTPILVSAASLIYAAGLTPAYFNPAPFMFAIVSTLLAVALLRYGLFRVNPVAHQTTFEEMDDAVLMVRDDGTVVDMNPAAIDLFGVDSGATREISAHSLFDDEPSPIDSVLDDEATDIEVSVTLDGQPRHFAVHSSPVEYGRGGRGWAILVSDITRLKGREQDLTILKQILSRVFRHNVRNELTTIVGRAELIDVDDDETAAHVDKILERCFTLRTYSEKARMIERVIDRGDSRTEHDLALLLTECVDDLAATYPETSIETTVDATPPVLGSQYLRSAVYNLIENGIVHNSSSAPRVDITVSTGPETVTVQITDNGPGIPEDEIEVLEVEAETALEHGSGLGLWLVNLVVDKSGGSLQIVSGSDGTTVEVELPRA